MRYKLVAMDLDSTLLDSNKSLAQSTINVIEEAKQLGVHFTIATGRMFRGAARYAIQLKIDIPIITYNGAVIKHPSSNSMSRLFKLPARAAKKALEIMDDGTFLRYVFLGDEVFTDTAHEWTDQYAEILGVTMNFVPSIYEILVEDPIMVVFMVARDKRDELTLYLKNHFDSDIRVTNSSEWFIDILHPQASKRLALKQLAESLSIKQDEIIALGDNLNDLEMIEYAGLGVAVANASEDLKSFADYVTKKPYYSGVEETIQRFVLDK